MKHYTIKNLEKNTDLVVKLKEDIVFNNVKISCSDFYKLANGGRIIDFGPERTAAGYSRVKHINLEGFGSDFWVRIIHYGIPTFDLDFQDFFFGIELYLDDKLVGDASDFEIIENPFYLKDSTKFSFQRAYVERYNFNVENLVKHEFVETASPIELPSLNQSCKFEEEKSALIRSGKFKGFDDYYQLPFTKMFDSSILRYDLCKSFMDTVGTNQFYYDIYKLEGGNKTGFIKLKFKSVLPGAKFYIYFDEYLVDGKFQYGRSSTIPFMEVTTSKGEDAILSAVPYTMQYIMVIHTPDVIVTPSVVKVENDLAKLSTKTESKDINLILEASLNTFKQNAYDTFTDCPGRERAGWLCDSYFTGIGEKYFIGSNKMERSFLENFIYCDCEEIEKNMLPMCFPSTHWDHQYIPNWAMWWVIEIERYVKDTGDLSIVSEAKDKIYGLVEFFKQFENEYSLLENLRSWVFIEWSKAGSPEFVKGCNFPTNMTYSYMLKVIGEFYDDKELLAKAKVIKDNINKLSFDGDYYHDNALREDGKLITVKDHISETAQYYALFFNINESKKLEQDMIVNFSLAQESNPHDMPKSNVFIGAFLRMLWLIRAGEYDRVLDEIIPYFKKMATSTNTLWENDSPKASCNHGLNAAVAPIIDACLNKRPL